jgi:hypothetical protein
LILARELVCTTRVDGKRVEARRRERVPEALCESVEYLIDALVVSNLLFISFDECVLNADGPMVS